jgi:ribosomal protein S18 acetylase RimI-like enzyme
MINNKTELAIRLEFVGSLTNPNNQVATAIKNLIVICDEEFIPPLSYRENAVAPIAKMHVHEKDCESYFEIISVQNNIVAYCNDKIVAFMSFRHNESHDHFDGVVRDGDVVNYVSTICVDKNFRRYGIANRLYDFIENKNNGLPRGVYGECVATRTWHTNESHIKLLDKRGYCLTDTLLNDRISNAGEKIDTVYFCKRLAFAN